MSELSDLKKVESNHLCMEELVTEVCAQILSQRELDHLVEGEQSRSSDAESDLKKRLTIKHLVKKFLENTGKPIKNLAKVSVDGSDKEGITSDKDDDTVSKTCKDNKNSIDVSKEHEKMETSETSTSEEKEVKPPYVIGEEEFIVSENNVKTIKDEKEKGSLTCEISEAGIMDEGIVLKTESSCRFDKNDNEIGLTEEEEEEIKHLIYLSESNYSETVSVKTEKEDDDMSNEENHNEGSGKCRVTCKSEPGAHYSTDTAKRTGSSVEAAGEPIKVHLSENMSGPISPNLLNDRMSPFYIRPHRMRIPLKYYEDNLLNRWWSPTMVLYELSIQCNWSKPEFRLLDYSESEGYWYAVKINNLNFVSYGKSKFKRQAKNLASARVFKFIGYQFNYELLARSKRRRRYAEPPWSDKYINYNSISLAKEEERLGLDYDYDIREPEISFDCFYDKKRKRSRSNESRIPKMRRIRSPVSDHRTSRIRRRSERREERSKSSRDTSLEISHRRTKPRIDHQGKEHRKPRLVHERISVTHVYDRESSSFSIKRP